MNQNGIQIGDTIVTSLTGPVSFYYLKPSKHVSPSEVKFFPLIVLFGDYHFSRQGSCENCTCPNSHEENGKCCYSISDHIFLKLLDTLGNNSPIDFYKETFLAGTHNNEENSNFFLGDLVSRDMVSCYHRTLRGTEHYNKCPTKNIRWHATDARQAGNAFNKITGDHEGLDYYHYKHGDRNVDELFQVKLNDKRFVDTISKKFRDDLYIEFQVFKLLQYLEYIIKSLIDKNNNHLIYCIDEFNKLLVKTEFGTIHNFITLLMTLYNEETKSIDFNKFSITFFSKTTRANSLIFKQIMKQEYTPFKDVSYWSNFYTQSLINIYHDNSFTANALFLTLNSIVDIFTSLDGLDNINNLYQLLSPRKLTINLNTIQGLISIIGVSFVDNYTLTRIFKKPEEGGNRSSLSFGYFGNAHVLNMVHLLLATKKYTLVKSMPFDDKRINKNNMRCLKFNFYLNLDEELRLHNELSSRQHSLPKNMTQTKPKTTFRSRLKTYKNKAKTAFNTLKKTVKNIPHTIRRKYNDRRTAYKTKKLNDQNNRFTKPKGRLLSPVVRWFKTLRRKKSVVV